VYLDKFSLDFLPKQQRRLLRINFFEITRQPAEPTRYIEPVATTTPGQFIPMSKLLFVLCARTHASKS
jgi:hypothetical protein